MGYREDVVVVVSKNGWENLINAISPNSDLLDQKKAQLVFNLIKQTDRHILCEKDGQHLMMWQSIKTYSADCTALFYVLKQMNENDYYVHCIGEDGAEELFGLFDNNVFCVSVYKQFCFDENFDDFNFKNERVNNE